MLIFCAISIVISNSAIPTISDYNKNLPVEMFSGCGSAYPIDVTAPTVTKKHYHQQSVIRWSKLQRTLGWFQIMVEKRH
jgi:hypothetical protein